MLLQKALTRKPKGEFMVDFLEAASGVCLALFLWAHLLFVSSVLLGFATFDMLAKFLEDYKLFQIGSPAIVVIFFCHVYLAGRRIPSRYKDAKIVWNHAKLISHKDTWSWVFQVISGLGILVLGTIHMFAVVSHWEITSAITKARAQHEFMIPYLILLFFGEYHAGVGLYRIFVKWSFMKRQSVGTVLNFITFCVIILGLATWGVLTGLYGGAK